MEDSFSIEAIDDLIHSRLRLGIMAYLSTAASADFTQLKVRLKATDGNLSVQIRKLEEAGYIAVEKSFSNRKPLTTISLTDRGRGAYIAYLEQIKKLIAE